MSDEVVIRVENLGKKYRIRHQGERQGYVALRDVIVDKLAAPFRAIFGRNGHVSTGGSRVPFGVSAEQAGDSPKAVAHPGHKVQLQMGADGRGYEDIGEGESSNRKSEIINPKTDAGEVLQTANPQSVIRNPQSVEDFWALKDVSFSVRQGEVVGIIGRNGAGKSTLLKVLSRITEPAEGRVWIKGRVASLLEVGTGFHPELTGRENIYLNGAILGMTRREIKRKFDEIVAFAEVEKFLDTPVKRYSSGMYVRLTFAVAAHLEPEILLVDEVLAVGDAEFQKKCLGKIGSVAAGGRTVLFVSHNMVAVRSLCSRAILLEAGKSTTEGDVEYVVARYLDRGAEASGEMSWPSPDVAPGNDRLRVRGVRIVSGETVTGTPDIADKIRIEIDYWNLEPDARRLVSVHIHNGEGICILATSNMASVCVTPDPWQTRAYPIGLFRTACTIPENFLNDGPHSVSLYINQRGARDVVIFLRDVLSFEVHDTGSMRKEYLGKWIGAVRPRLDWRTIQLDGLPV